MDRGDYNAGRSLFRRASGLLAEDDAKRAALAPDQALALFESDDLEQAQLALAHARRAGGPRIAAIATTLENVLDFHSGGEMPAAVRLARLEDAYPVLEAAGDDEGLGYYWMSLAGEKWFSLQAAETVIACERGLEHFRRAGMARRMDDLLWSVRSAYVFGPIPRPEAIERMRELQREAGDSMQLQAGAATSLARLLAMQGDFEEARELYAFGRGFYESAGMGVSAAGVTMHGAWIEHRAGDLAAWERVLRIGLSELEALGNKSFFATMAVYLAECLYLQDRLDEVPTWCQAGRDASPAGDLINLVYADALEGCILAHDGRHEEASRLLRRAVELVETTDFFFARAEVRLFHAEVLARAGEPASASVEAGAGLRILDEKGDLTGASVARARLGRLGIHVP